MMDLHKMRKKTFIIQKFLLFLVVIRMYISEIPLLAFISILVLLILYKQKRQGNTPIFAITLLACISMVLGQLFKSNLFYISGPILAGIGHFMAPTIYWFPPIKKLVGFRQTVIQNNLYMMQLYPLNQQNIESQKIISWNNRLQLKKMAEHDGYDKNIIKFSIFKFFISAIKKTKFIFGQGQQIINNKTALIFSHGRTATPMMYSQILLQMAYRQINIFAVQHTQKTDPQIAQIDKIKKFRQMEVIVRAAQMYSSICQSKQKKIILMGHSYGGATVIQTYHSLDQQTKKRVKCIILLDPWLFPLNKLKFRQQLSCPVLILACEYFMSNQDVYLRNKQFVQTHKKDNFVYLCWKRADHLHFTDFGFILGNTFNTVKHSEESLGFLQKNCDTIDVFLKGQHSQDKLQAMFKQQLCQRDYKPVKFTNYLKY